VQPSTSDPAFRDPLTANVVFPGSGTWKLFAQLQVNGQLHTAAFTVMPASQ
jgi:hypothetical protein